MPKINKKNLARGAKLSSQHIESNLDPVSIAFSDTFLDKQNLAETKVPFYVNFSFAGFKNDVLGFDDQDQRTNGMNANLVFPIPLIPTQDQFSNQGELDADVPIYLLESVSVSMDLRAEGAAMTYDGGVPIYPNPESKSWRINYEKASAQDIEIALLQKDYTYFNEQQEFPTNSIFTTTIPATIAFAGSESRVENPYYVFGINKQINPYKSYYLAFSVPNQIEREFFISNLVISFKFYTLLNTNPEYTEFTSNKAQENSISAIGNYNLNLQSPAPYSTISADDANTGLQTNLQRIDEALQEKITTGYGDKFGNLGSFLEDGELDKQAISTPAVYDVVVVPMWQGTFGFTGLITTNSPEGFPSDINFGPINPAFYDDPQLYEGPIQDIRTIPLFYPFTIHHILAWHNEQARGFQTFGNGSNSGAVQGSIGVGLGTCFQADKYTYEQIGFHQYNNTFNNTIDTIKLRDNVFNRQGVYGSAIKTAGHLMQVPLIPGIPNGNGFFSQGFPFYCGGGTKRMDTRTFSPSTQGMENFIEIRWEFNSSNGWVDNPNPPDNQDPQVIAGLGGHFVYLIGKKLLTTNRNNLQE